MKTTNDYFIAALKKKLKKQGRGAKQKFAAQVVVSPNHLSDILSQRKNAGQKLKERMLAALGVTFEDMLILGRHILEDSSDETTDSEERNELGSTLVQEPGTTADFMAMATKILESDTPYRQALMSNLIGYCQAINIAQKEEAVLQMIRSFQEEMGIMRKDLDQLKRPDSGEDILATNTTAA